MDLLLAALPSLLATAIFWGTFRSRSRAAAKGLAKASPRQPLRAASTAPARETDRRAA